MFAEPPNQHINVIPAWNAGVNGSGVNVLVLDDGIDYTHPDLLPNWVRCLKRCINHPPQTN